MTIRNLNDNVDLALSLVPAARVNGTATGTAVDLRGYDSAVVAVAFGTVTDGSHVPSLQHSVDGSTYATVTAAELSGAFATATSSSGGSAVQRVGYLGDRRYLRVIITTTGATTGALCAATVVRGHPQRAPLA